MAKGTAQSIAAKWSTNTVAAVNQGYFATGVDQYVQDNPNMSPSAKAALNVNYWLSQLNKSQQRWVTNSQQVTSQSWATAMKQKGASRITTGVPLAEGKFQIFMGQLLNYIGNDPAASANLPPKDGTIAGGIARASAWITYMSHFQPQNAPGFTVR